MDGVAPRSTDGKPVRVFMFGARKEDDYFRVCPPPLTASKERLGAQKEEHRVQYELIAPTEARNAHRAGKGHTSVKDETD